MKKFNILSPDEKQKMLKEFESEISTKKNEWQEYNTVFKNSLSNVENVKDLNPSLEHLNILRAEISKLEAELKKIERYMDRDRGDDFDECEEQENEPPIIDQQAIGKGIAGQGVINIRPDIKLFRAAARALTYQQILDKEAREDSCEKRDDIKEIIREILNHSHK